MQTSEDDGEEEGDEAEHKPAEQQRSGSVDAGQGRPADASRASGSGKAASLAGQEASIASVEEGELVGARLPSGLLAEQQIPEQSAEAPGGNLATHTPAPVAAVSAAATQELATEPTVPGLGSAFEAEDAAAALQHLAALSSAAWEEVPSGEESEGSGGGYAGRKRRAGRPPSRAPPERRPRKQRPAKLWCRYPLDGSRWALILSQSAISSRQISLPWTNPGAALLAGLAGGCRGRAARDGAQPRHHVGACVSMWRMQRKKGTARRCPAHTWLLPPAAAGDMACELLGRSWVEAVRRRTRAGTNREPAGGRRLWRPVCLWRWWWQPARLAAGRKRHSGGCAGRRPAATPHCPVPRPPNPRMAQCWWMGTRRRSGT